MTDKKKIKDYWQNKQPSLWYSKKDYGSIKYYDDTELKRYNKFYPHIPLFAEFKNHKDKKVLEIGVGMGTDLKQYAKNGSLCYGIDLTEGSIEQTKKHLQMYDLTANLKVMDAENLQYENDKFDIVYSVGVLHHTPNTKKCVEEIYRVLKPNGKAIILLYSKSWQHYVFRFLIAGLWYRELKTLTMQEIINKYSEAYGNSPLTKLYHKYEIKKLFSCFDKFKITHYHYKNKFFQWKSGYYMGNWVIKAEKR